MTADPTLYSCDGGTGCTPGPTYRLELAGGAGLYLCRHHWALEMRWRLERNRDLRPAARFPLEPWPDWPTTGQEPLTR